MDNLSKRDIMSHISSKACSVCGGETSGFKCPECGTASDHYDPLHFKKCSKGGKLRAKCKGCGEAEDNCKC